MAAPTFINAGQTTTLITGGIITLAVVILICCGMCFCGYYVHKKEKGREKVLVQVVQTREIKKQRRASGRQALVVQVSPSAAPAHRQSVVVTMLVERFDNALDMVAGRSAEAGPEAALRKSVVATPDDLQRRPSTFRRASALLFSKPAAKVADRTGSRKGPPGAEQDMELYDIYEESSSDDDDDDEEAGSARRPAPGKPKAYNIYDANGDSDDDDEEGGRSMKSAKSVKRNR